MGGNNTKLSAQSVLIENRCERSAKRIFWTAHNVSVCVCVCVVVYVLFVNV